MPHNHPHFGHLIRKLMADPRINVDEIARVAELPITLRLVKPGTVVIREGDMPTQCCLIVSGYMCRMRFVTEGKRQIMSFHLRGDFPDLQSLHIEHADHDLVALTECLVGFVPHRFLNSLMFDNQSIGSFFWREALIDAAIFREWIVNIGRRDGFERIAHLFCEQAIRLKVQGLGDETGFPNFLRQNVIADATGLTSVHVNRIMQKLKDRDLIKVSNGRMNIPDWQALVAAGDFRSNYLHLR